MNYCGSCGTKLNDGACAACTAKSTTGINMETLEKSLSTLEELSKGMRPAEAKGGEGDNRVAKDMVEAAKNQVKKYGAKGEGDSEEEPKTKRGVESATKGGFVPPDEEEEMEREREAGDGDGDGGEEGFCPPTKMKSAGKKAKKSFADELVEQPSIKKAVDVSEFLESLVYQLGEFNDDLRNDVAKSIAFGGYQQKFNVGLAGALAELGSIVKSLGAKVEQIGNSPATTRKSDQSVATIEKSFSNGNENPTTTLTKGQIASKLMALMEAGDKTIEAQDIVRAESSGAVRPELRAKLGIDAQQ